jgi:hypothetical protein
MEPDLLKYLAPLGVGGILAAFIFWFNRKDSNDNAKKIAEYAAAWQGQSQLLLQVVKENTASNTSLQATTAALQSVITGLQRDMAEREAWWRGHFPRA